MAKVKSLLAFYCERCSNAVLDDDVGYDGENNLCEPCVTKWANEEFRRVTGWQPLQTSMADKYCAVCDSHNGHTFGCAALNLTGNVIDLTPLKELPDA